MAIAAPCVALPSILQGNRVNQATRNLCNAAFCEAFHQLGRIEKWDAALLSRWRLRQQWRDISDVAYSQVLFTVKAEFAELIAAHSIEQSLASEQERKVLPARNVFNLNAK